MSSTVCKKNIRQSIRAQRRALSNAEQQLAALAVRDHLNHWSEFRRAKRLAFYLANDGEVQTDAAIDLAWSRKQSVFLPVIQSFHFNRMRFSGFTKKTILSANRFGILEPVHKTVALQTVMSLHMVFMPLVAFDAKGARLGMGGGFYDRSFAFLLNRQSWRQPKLIGLAHDFQQVQQLQMEAWDVPLHAVVTPAGITRF
ncbi:MAG: 5-formyltetrahydrofolate cyclo-ligase [Gammaproteobacteria bacterium]|nr:5-formyltetrahydrofolate cyclo-ligase [Gammaproteobacteria bacterium]